MSPRLSDFQRTPEQLKEQGLDNTCTALEMFRLARLECLAGEMEAAAKTWVIASVYGLYDAGKLGDKAAVEIVGVLQRSTTGGLPAETQREFEKSIRRAKDSPETRAALEGLGKPNYEPTYLLRLGDLKERMVIAGEVPFDSEGTWRMLVNRVGSESRSGPEGQLTVE